MKRYEYESEFPNNGWDGMMAMLERRGKEGWHLSATWGDWFLFARLLPEQKGRRVSVRLTYAGLPSKEVFAVDADSVYEMAGMDLMRVLRPHLNQPNLKLIVEVGGDAPPETLEKASGPQPPVYDMVHLIACAIHKGLPCNCHIGAGCVWCGKVTKRPCVDKVEAGHCVYTGCGAQMAYETHPPVTPQEEEAFREKERVVSVASVQHDLRQLNLPQLYEVLDSVQTQIRVRHSRMTVGYDLGKERP